MKKLCLLLAVVCLAGCGGDVENSQIEEMEVISDKVEVAEGELFNNSKNIEEVLTNVFSVIGEIPEMQELPLTPKLISSDLYYSLLFYASLNLRLLNVYDNFEVKVEFRPYEYIEVSPEEYVISLLVFHPREMDPYPKVGLREGFLLKFFVSVQKNPEGWSIKNIEIVNSGFLGSGDRFTKYLEKNAQKEMEKIITLKKVTYEEAIERLNSLEERREEAKAVFLESLEQPRPSYLRRTEKEDFD